VRSVCHHILSVESGLGGDAWSSPGTSVDPLSGAGGGGERLGEPATGIDPTGNRDPVGDPGLGGILSHPFNDPRLSGEYGRLKSVRHHIISVESGLGGDAWSSPGTSVDPLSGAGGGGEKLGEPATGIDPTGNRDPVGDPGLGGILSHPFNDPRLMRLSG
jgi:hypothetical protein